MTDTQVQEPRAGSYWLIVEGKNPLVISGQLPIYWKKEVAENEAKRLGGKVVKVTCLWQINQTKSK